VSASRPDPANVRNTDPHAAAPKAFRTRRAHARRRPDVPVAVLHPTRHWRREVLQPAVSVSPPAETTSHMIIMKRSGPPASTRPLIGKSGYLINPSRPENDSYARRVGHWHDAPIDGYAARVAADPVGTGARESGSGPVCGRSGSGRCAADPISGARGTAWWWTP
jgi:hypothetical protein